MTERLLQNLSPREIAPLENAMRADFADGWRDFALSLFVSLLRMGKAPDDAAPMAAALARGIGRDMGGFQVYIQTGSQASQNTRTQTIVREFNGANHVDLAIRHGISERSVRRILERDRIARMKANAATLKHRQLRANEAMAHRGSSSRD